MSAQAKKVFYNRVRRTCLKHGIDIVYDGMPKAVFGIKAGADQKIHRDLLADAGQHLLDRGADLIVLGCTEIPLAYDTERVDVPIVDATRVLAERSVKMFMELEAGKKPG